MNVNADFTQRVMLHSDAIEWENSPMPGVVRRRLDRVDGEIDRVTTVVRYAPESKFSSHMHPHGEEFIVLDGVFEDDYGRWPEGSYVRNPPQSEHTPGSTVGCTMFVKLCQFQPEDRTFVYINMNKQSAVPDRTRVGVSVTPLYKDAWENVRLEHWEPNTSVEIDATGGAEIFVIEGEFEESGDSLRKHSWLRVPINSTIKANTGTGSAKVWIKSGHLASTA